MRKLLTVCVAMLLFANTWAQDNSEVSSSYTTKPIKRNYVRLFASETNVFYSGESSEYIIGDYRNFAPGARLGVQVGTRLFGSWYFDAGVNVSYNNWSKEGYTEASPGEYERSTSSFKFPGGIYYSSTSKYKNTKDEVNYHIHNVALSIPLNFSWKLKCGKNVTIEPFVGMHFKFNLMSGEVTTVKTTRFEESNFYSVTLDDNLNIIDRYSHSSTSKDRYKNDETLDLHDSDEMGDVVHRRFLLGWQAGVGLNIKKLYVGVEYQADYNCMRSANIEIKNIDNIHTHIAALNIGYNF